MSPDSSHLERDPWRDLESAWQLPLDPPESAALDGIHERAARTARRQQRIGIAVIVTEVLVCLVFGGLALYWLWQGDPAFRVAGAFVLTLITGTAIYRRSTWAGFRAVEEKAPELFVEALLARNLRGYQAIRLGYILLAIEVLFFIAWLFWIQGPWVDAESFLFLAVWTAGFVAALELCRRYLNRERRRLESLLAELRDLTD